MMFLVGVVSLNAKKYEIIYFSKRTLPVKVKSIGNWVTVIRVVGVVGVFTNVAILIYVRKAIAQNQSIAFFMCVFFILLIKYLISFSKSSEDEVGKRCKIKTEELISESRETHLKNKNNLINTDIENLYYDEIRLKRKLPNLKGANIKCK
jgi:hypothetical protein